MKLYRVALRAFGVSLLMGGLLFLGIPYIFFLLIDDKPFQFMDSELAGLPIAMFVVYVIIQFWLSAINLVQAIFMLRKGKAVDSCTDPHPFYIAEAVLYMIVFFPLAICIGFIEAVPFILVFSIPYIICCTASVYLFKYILIRIYRDGALEIENTIADGTA
ncbi:MAG: hypothetical protein JWO03_1884 [Bacteroidetes bacterium]|nr:hypothetical protein [Bacteroidota bacterium]